MMIAVDAARCTWDSISLFLLSLSLSLSFSRARFQFHKGLTGRQIGAVLIDAAVVKFGIRREIRRGTKRRDGRTLARSESNRSGRFAVAARLSIPIWKETRQLGWTLSRNYCVYRRSRSLYPPATGVN